MIKNLFSTDVIHEPTGLPDELLASVVNWAEAQQFTDVAAGDQRATKNGRQFEPKRWPWGYMPMWDALQKALDSYVKAWAVNYDEDAAGIGVTGYWFVFYEAGGFQEPHLHPGAENSFTAILGLEGEGDVLLHDPRAAAVKAGWKAFHKVTIKKGDIFIMPSWIIHSSSPCKEKRTIMVIDGKAT